MTDAREETKDQTKLAAGVSKLSADLRRRLGRQCTSQNRMKKLMSFLVGNVVSGVEKRQLAV